MADTYSSETRSYVMSRIRKKNTKPEIFVRSFLFRKGFRFRIHVKNLPGNPDIVLPKYNTVILINGCFWHAHRNCKLNRMPKTRQDYWIPKITKNVERDKSNNILLSELGWRVLTIWECDLTKAKRDDTLNMLFIELNKKIS